MVLADDTNKAMRYNYLFKTASVFVLSLILLSACARKKIYALYQSSQQYQVTANTTRGMDSAIERLLKYYKADLNNKMQETVVVTDMPLTKAQPESTLGNWVADAILQSAQYTHNKVVAAVINYGSIGVDYIAPGAISHTDIYKIIPFDNKVVIVPIQGRVLRQLCDTMAQNKGWPISGISFVIDSNRATKIKIGGAPVNDNLVYNIATNNFLANAGTHMYGGLLKTVQTIITGISVREALNNYGAALSKAGKPMHINIENRISYAE